VTAKRSRPQRIADSNPKVNIETKSGGPKIKASIKETPIVTTVSLFIY
jgi:hypothetical protein